MQKGGSHVGKVFDEVRGWMHRNAREIELSAWRCLFEGCDVRDVPRALAFYQNEDGGFGHALEADLWNPHSSPYTTLYALGILKAVGFHDLSHPVYRGILRYMESCAELADYGWRFSIATNDDFPHAPWWTYNEEGNRRESIGLTASLAAFALRGMEAGARVRGKALALGVSLAGRLEEEGGLGEMGIGGLIELLPALKAAGAQGLDYEALELRLREHVHKSIERDTSKWATHVVRPSRYIQSPDSPFYAENADIVRRELAYLLDTREAGGVWPIDWSWFDLMDRYAREFAISENWWKGQKAIESMLFLRNFGMDGA